MSAPACRICRCTEDDCSGCVERTGATCCWIPEQSLQRAFGTQGPICSACAELVMDLVTNGAVLRAELPLAIAALKNSLTRHGDQLVAVA